MISTGFASRAIRGVRWNYLGALGRIVATLLSQVALARLLGPESFGLFGYALLTVTLTALVVEMGLPSALVQTAELDDQTLAIACGRLLLTGCAAAALLFLLADVIAAGLFAAPKAAPVLRAMAPTLVVGVAASVATALIGREIEFKVIQVAALASYVVGYLVVGVTAALMGLGVWSLVLAWHVQTMLACAILIAKSPRALTLANPLRKLRITNFGIVVMATNVANWVIDNGPHSAIGRWLGASSLGLYTVANNLVRVPADHLVRNLQTVLHPLASRARGNDAGLRRAYLTVLAGVAILAVPTFTYVALMAEPLVSFMLGDKWLAAGDVLVPLALAMVLHALEALAGPTLSGRGEPRVELHVKLVMLPVMLAALAVTAHWSLVAVGWGVVAVYLVRWIWMNAALGKRLNITATDFAHALAGPCVLAILAGGLPSAIMAALNVREVAWPAAGLLAATAATAALAIIFTALAAPQLVLGRYLLALLNAPFEKRPTWARRPGFKRVAAGAAHAAAEFANPDHGAAASWTRRPKTS